MILFCGLVLMSILFCQSAHAHKASIFAWIQGDTIHTQSNLMGDKRPNQALVEVFGENGKLLLQGRTDEQGQFSFPAPQKSHLKIVLNAGGGHRAVWSVTPLDFAEAASESGHVHTHDVTAQSDPIGTNKINPSENAAIQAGVTREEIAALVASALDQKIAPVMAKLAEMDQKRIIPADIIGGLGYILGLVGLAAFMNYRRKIKDKSI